MSKLIAFVLAAAALIVSSNAADAYKWTVQYLIDNSQAVFGRTQKNWPRHNRGLAISPDGKYLYAGYNHSFEGQGEVRKISVAVADYERATVASLPGVMGKAIATDDKGRVYIANTNELLIYDANLEQRQARVITGVSDGVAVARDGASLILFTSDRGEGVIRRWVLSENDAVITDAKPAGFDGTGVFRVPGAADLRGIEVDGLGNIWVCDIGGDKVFRVRKDGKAVKSVDVESPIDLGFDGERAFITRWTDRKITVVDKDLIVIGDLHVPWDELALSPLGNNQTGALSGIVTVPGKGFFVTNEGGQTANQISTYGKVDDHSDVVDGVLVRDARTDDNDPILKATSVTTE